MAILPPQYFLVLLLLTHFCPRTTRCQVAESHFCNREKAIDVIVEEKYLAEEWQTLEIPLQGYKDRLSRGDNVRLLRRDDASGMCQVQVLQTVERTRPRHQTRLRVVRDCCQGWLGDNCNIPICEPECVNGQCIFPPDICHCSPGYTGPTCETPVCDPSCMFGECTSPDHCECSTGFSGPTCDKAVCEHGCLYGDCISPNLCKCDDGYEGLSCENAICNPECVSGVCVAPDECHCHPGFSGKLCEKGPVANKEHKCKLCCGGAFVSFDGYYYTFPTAGLFNLASCDDCGIGAFSVRVDASYPCNEETCHIYNKVIISYRVGSRDFTVELLPQHGVRYENQDVTDLPLITDFGTVSKIGVHTVFKGFQGNDVIVRVDTSGSIDLRVSDLFRGSMNGMCGNFDSDAGDDDVSTEVAQGFGMSSEAIDPLDPCNLGQNEQLADAAYIICSEMLAGVLDGFRACFRSVKPARYHEMCLFSMCQCLRLVGDAAPGPCFTEGRKAILCDVLTQYSRDCTAEGVLPNWRREDLCPVHCDNGMVYTECGSPCPRTCENLDFQEECEQYCVDGCHCPAGTFWDRTKCVSREECPCPRGSDMIPAGNAITSGCKLCTCLGGRWDCTTNECNATCSVSGGHHFKTFDGSNYLFPASGSCEYLLAELTDPNFSILVEFEDCSASLRSCLMIVSIVTADQSIYELNSQSSIKASTQSGTTSHKLPFRVESADGSTLVARQVSSIFTRLTIAEHGIDVLLGRDGRLYLTLNPKWQTKVHGLCGTYNSKQIDDFTALSGVDAKAKINFFGNSWKMGRHCPDVEEDAALRPCDLHSQRVHLANRICKMLRQPPFNECNKLVPVDKYEEQCRDAVCGCHASDNQCQCLAFASYARECVAAGDKFHWRSAQFCPVKCPSGEVYKICGSNCVSSCGDISSDQFCQEECVEGCQCPEGRIRDVGSGQCVPVEDCSCEVDGVVYGSRQSWRRGCNECYCSAGTYRCTEKDCTAYESCADGMEWLLCQECERTCQNAYLPCVQTICTPGCGCPEGKVLHKGTCIQVEECSCDYNGKSYKVYEKVAMDCHECMCNTDHRWICDDDTCPSTCSSYGDSHFVTFDMRRYKFQGDCEYTLVEDFCGEPEGSFRVLIENIPCGENGVTCTKAIKFTLYDTTIYLVRGRPYTVTVNSEIDTKARIKMEDAGMYLVIKTPDGITLKWDYGTSVHVTLDPLLAGQVCGLCGDFNGDANDDFKTRNREIEAMGHSFGHSWRTVANCAEPREVLYPCDSMPHRRPWAEKVCGIIKKSLFSSCHNLVDPEPYFLACVFDTCACDRGADCECMCTAIAAYAMACNENNVAMAWRSDGYCALQCENGRKYQACGKICPDKCYPSHASEDYGCETHCVEGCHCPEGQVLFRDKCIERQLCPCFIDNGRVQIKHGALVVRDCMQCMCNGGHLECSGTNCTQRAVIATKKPCAHKPPPTCTCPPGFSCCADQTFCIQDTKFCDGELNCKDSSDELQCDCEYKGIIRSSGDTWSGEGRCEVCRCEAGRTRCFKECNILCDALTEVLLLNEHDDTQCCQCKKISIPTTASPVTTTATSECEEGTTVQPDECRTCDCIDGTYSCYYDCHKRPNSCAEGEQLVSFEDKCCECVSITTTLPSMMTTPTVECLDPFVVGEPTCCQYMYLDTCEIPPTFSGSETCNACKRHLVFNGTHCVFPNDCLCQDVEGVHQVGFNLDTKPIYWIIDQ
ncbi:SCO-spondin-like [Acanthaster planci]|uniref:SCO-spondin-like n=1 Tax=Acanthaster planci TaxID=133434 RepID=A0A8B7ZTV0_ACAPL|nr:SCO-spondin-like [Acanthaster planci]